MDRVESRRRNDEMEMREMSCAYRISGADKVFNTDLKTSRVLGFLIGLLWTRHDCYALMLG